VWALSVQHHTNDRTKQSRKTTTLWTVVATAKELKYEEELRQEIH
jgi:hypothetical protein